MKAGLLVAIAAFIVIMLGGCDDGGGSINEKRAEGYRLLTYEPTCVQYIVIGRWKEQAGLGPMIDKDGRPILDQGCVYKHAAIAASNGE